MKLAGLEEVAGHRQADHVAHLARNHVRSHRDDTLGADRNHRDRKRIVAGENREVGREVLDRADALDGPRRLLDGNDVRMRAETRDHVERNLLAGAAGHVVEDNRQPEVGNRHEVTIKALGIRLVVVRRHLEAGVGAAGRNRRLRQRHRLGRGVRPRAGQDLDLARSKFDHLLDDLVMLGMIKGRRLARRADGADALDATGDLELDELLQLAVVNGAVLRERRDQGCNRTRKFHSFD